MKSVSRNKNVSKDKSKDKTNLALENKKLKEVISEKDYEIKFLSEILDKQKEDLKKFEKFKVLYKEMKKNLDEKDKIINRITSKENKLYDIFQKPSSDTSQIIDSNDIISNFLSNHKKNSKKKITKHK